MLVYVTFLRFLRGCGAGQEWAGVGMRERSGEFVGIKNQRPRQQDPHSELSEETRGAKDGELIDLEWQ